MTNANVQRQYYRIGAIFLTLAVLITFGAIFGTTLVKCKEVEICAVKAIGALVVQREALINVKAFEEHTTKYKLYLQTSFRMMRV